jgi:hypothetical protein
VRILIFHARLAHLSGGQVNTRDWALGLKSRGHKVVVYTLEPGPIAEEVHAAGIPIVTDPAQITDAPDIMVGSGINDIVTLLARFPDVPAIQVGQVWGHWNGYPCLLPQAVLHVVVDDLNAELFANDFGIPRDRIRIIHNAVDLTRVASRKRPLPSKPERALVFVKHENDSAYHDALRAACSARNISLDFFGYPIDRPLLEPLAAITNYDLVVGAARTSIEGAVVGAAVLVADHRGLAGMLTTANLARFRQDNFGRELLTRPIDAATIGEEIDHYDASDAAEVSRILREDASLDRALDRWEAAFAEAMALFKRAPPASDDVRKALASYLSQHLPRPWEPSPRHDRLKGSMLLEEQLAALTRDVDRRLTALGTRVDEQLSSLARQVDKRTSDAASHFSAASEQAHNALSRIARLEGDLASVRQAAGETDTIRENIKPLEDEIASVRQSAGETGNIANEIGNIHACISRIEDEMVLLRQAAAESRNVSDFIRRNAALLRFLRPAALAFRRLPWVKFK